MITDNFCIFFDHKTGAATDDSAVVNVSPLAGRDDVPVNITILLAGATTASTTLTVTIKESADGSTWSDVATFPVVKPDALTVVAVFALPYSTRERKIRLSYALAPTAQATNVTIWAGVTRDHYAPYLAGMYLDHGKVIG
jgi:hypothetical protein